MGLFISWLSTYFGFSIRGDQFFIAFSFVALYFSLYFYFFPFLVTILSQELSSRSLTYKVWFQQIFSPFFVKFAIDRAFLRSSANLTVAACSFPAAPHGRYTRTVGTSFPLFFYHRLLFELVTSGTFNVLHYLPAPSIQSGCRCSTIYVLHQRHVVTYSYSSPFIRIAVVADPLSTSNVAWISSHSMQPCTVLKHCVLETYTSVKIFACVWTLLVGVFVCARTRGHIYI